MMEFPKTLIFLRPLLMTPLFLGRALGSPDRFFFFCLIVPIVVVGRWSLSSFDFSHLISVLSQCLVSFILITTTSSLPSSLHVFSSAALLLFYQIQDRVHRILRQNACAISTAVAAAATLLNPWIT